MKRQTGFWSLFILLILWSCSEPFDPGPGVPSSRNSHLNLTFTYCLDSLCETTRPGTGLTVYLLKVEDNGEAGESIANSLTDGMGIVKFQNVEEGSVFVSAKHLTGTVLERVNLWPNSTSYETYFIFE